MDVIFIINSLRSGGAEKQLLWIAAQVARNGNASVMELQPAVANSRVTALIAIAEEAGVKFVRTTGGGFLASLRQLRLLQAERPDATVWSWGLRADSVVFIVRKGGRRFRWLVSARSADARRMRYSYMRFLAVQSDGVVANSYAGLETFGRETRTKQWMLPNVLELSGSRPVALPLTAPEVIVIVMLGNIDISIKGYDIALAMCRLLKTKRFRFQLRIAGRPDQASALASLIAKEGVGAEVRYVGEVSKPQEYLEGGHIYLLTSRFEGMPNTVLEALSVGLPVIATAVGDLRKFQQERGAPIEVVEVGDADAVAAVVVAVRDNWEHVRQRAALGPAWVAREFSAARALDILKRILAA